ncbi:hypothetical protein [Brachybacterium hainanense]|uniref:Uncharacterized protein n=1 Tax=Brachybacterium hainanense TaxID=1541174 RepID=A0ABV6RE45_9MICO
MNTFHRVDQLHRIDRVASQSTTRTEDEVSSSHRLRLLFAR